VLSNVEIFSRPILIRCILHLHIRTAGSELCIVIATAFVIHCVLQQLPEVDVIDGTCLYNMLIRNIEESCCILHLQNRTSVRCLRNRPIITGSVKHLGDSYISLRWGWNEPHEDEMGKKLNRDEVGI